ncbi:MAG: zinc ribbon domain-containing protein [Verrucomicrobiota bacterium]
MESGKQALVCPYCSTAAPAQVDAATGEIHEHDLVTALRDYAQEHRGWKTQRISVKCQSCQAISVFEGGRVAQRCDFCGSTAIVPYEIKPPVQPESLLPFKVPEATVRESMRQWYASRWFAPNRLKTRALTDQVNGIYLPYWTFDAAAHADWTAESGYYYYTTETERDANGQTRTRQVRHVRWQSSAGALDHAFDDELVCASVGVNEELLRGIEPFPTKELTAYSPSYLSGWLVEQYQIDLIAAAQRSREKMEAELRALCAAQVPGDTHRNLQVYSRYANQTFKHILVPVWLLTFNYGADSYQAVINGYTGRIAGRYPKSWIKILFFVLMIAAAVGIGFALFGR